jgi:hypothetical protein
MIFRIWSLGLLAAAALIAADDFGIAGSWTGESLCTGTRAACQDEHVIWTFMNPDSAGLVSSSADKVVDGKRINMGTAELQFNRETSTLTWRIPLGIWKLTMKKDTIEGTLTLNDGEVVRRMNLKKDK